jgi:hypothetical protein
MLMRLYRNRWQHETSLETEIEGPQDDNGVAHVFFKGINIQGAGSNFTVIADRNCPPYTAYIMTMDDWALYSLKSVPSRSGR